MQKGISYHAYRKVKKDSDDKMHVCHFLSPEGHLIQCSLRSGVCATEGVGQSKGE